MSRYRVLLPLTVHTDDGSYTQGEEFDKEFSEEDEATNLDSGLLELVPREYRVLTDTQVYETGKGETFMAALRIGNEAHLVDAGLVEALPRPELEKPVPKKRARVRA